jgi:hypothetical protein
LAAGIFGLSYLIEELLSTQKINQSLNFNLYLFILSEISDLKQAIGFKFKTSFSCWITDIDG